ncbi:MAG: ParD-like family protein [Oceanicaulis sp.]|nr:ParD-like family protein [Oceanicaulis sp.]
MAKSVKFADDSLIDDARSEAELQSRSLAGQITHWARLGRAIERSGRLDHVKISLALAGELGTDRLTAEEKAIWSERFLVRMSEPGPNEDAFFEELRKNGQAPGLDASGRIVQAGAPPEK